MYQDLIASAPAGYVGDSLALIGSVLSGFVLVLSIWRSPWPQLRLCRSVSLLFSCVLLGSSLLDWLDTWAVAITLLSFLVSLQAAATASASGASASPAERRPKLSDHERTRMAATIAVFGAALFFIGIVVLPYSFVGGLALSTLGALGAVQAVLVGLGVVRYDRRQADNDE